jgi:glycosyltransferase involved in cell wall biosynthesis
MEYPNVSINMPIYNRSKWLPLIAHNIIGQQYPKDKLELVILDDSSDDPLFKEIPQEIFENWITPVKLKYIRDPVKKSIGEKRNKLCKLSSHKIIACMDSDDLYLPTYLTYAVGELKENKLSAVGSPEMLFIFPFDDWKITGIKCLANRQIHEATLVYTKKHFKAMGGFAKNSQGEGAKMFDFMNDKQIKQLSVEKIMVCICHNENTCNKDKFNELDKQNAWIGDYEKAIISKVLSIT